MASSASWVRIPHGASIATQTKTHNMGPFYFNILLHAEC